jgi:uncharacterized protein (TIGR03382 family)
MMRSGIVAAVVVVVGVIVLLGGHLLVERSRSRLLQSSSDAVARIRELDSILLQLSRGSQGQGAAASALAALLELELSSEEREGIRGVAECLAEELCDVESTVANARHAVEAGLSVAWGRARVGGASGHTAMGVGVLLCLAGAVLAVLVRRRWRPALAPEPNVDVESMRAVLHQRSEPLDDTQHEAWEKERFAILGEIAAGLSHGLKTPLAGIRAAAQLAETRVDTGHPAREQLADIITEVDVLAEQIRRFLQASGAGAPVPSHVDPGAIVDALAAEYVQPAHEQGLEWQADIADGLGMLFVDPALLLVALRNLAENALAAAPRGSRVAVTARACDRPDVPEGSHLVDASRWMEIAIRDQGPGTPENVFSSDRSATNRPHGSALGLALARRIVARHGGALLCEPGNSDGTLVRVVLPASEPPPMEADG